MEGSSQQIIVYNDHKNLQSFQSARVLSRQQARWMQFLTRFDFIILYRPGMQQGKAYAYLDIRIWNFNHEKQILLGPDRIRLMAFHAIDTPGDSSLLDSIREHIEMDEFSQDILNHIILDCASCSQSQKPCQEYNPFSWHDGLLFRQNLLYVPYGPSRL